MYSIKNSFLENYVLNYKNNGALIEFEYTLKQDTIRRLDFKYLKEKDILLLGLDTLFPIKSIYKPKEIKFKMYQFKQRRNHIRTLVFNSKYGLLASLNYKSHKLFLKDSISKIDKENLFKGLFLELNKMHIE